MSQVSLTWALSKSHWSLRPSWLVWGLACTHPTATHAEHGQWHSCESSAQVRRCIPDISVIGLDLLNYLAVEGEKLQSNASHLWFATGSLHHLGWTRKIKAPCTCHAQTKKFPVNGMKATALRQVTNMLFWSVCNSLCQCQHTESKKEFQTRLLWPPEYLRTQNSSYSYTEAGHFCNTSHTQQRPVTLSSIRDGLQWKQHPETSQKGNCIVPVKDTTTTAAVLRRTYTAFGLGKPNTITQSKCRVHCNVHLCTSCSHEDKEN